MTVVMADRRIAVGAKQPLSVVDLRPLLKLHFLAFAKAYSAMLSAAFIPVAFSNP